jgi:DNA invertase Pin-like site-specific DNA recombinase
MPAQPAYIRRSYVDPDSPGDISLEAQRAAVRELAHDDGNNGNVVEYNDWGVSADVAKSAKRTEYARLLADMEAGQVSAVYAFDVDRLYRDPRDLIRLQDAAERHAVRIVTTGGPLAIGDGDDPAAEGFAFMGAVFGRMELQKAKKRARAAREARKARGDRFGHAPYGYKHVRDDTGRIVRVRDETISIESVLQAFRDAGNVQGACRLLEQRGILAPKGGSRWALSALTRIIEREAPGLLPRKGPTGRRQPARALLAQLLRCHCGTVMTPNVTRGQYYCNKGKIEGAAKHGKYNVREVDLLPWVHAEAARFRVPGDMAIIKERDEGVRLDLEGRRRRVIDNYEDGIIDKAERDAKLLKIAEEVELLDVAESAIEIPPAIDWNHWNAKDINAVLRTFWEHIELGEDMQPVRAVWRLPAEYIV